jgi:putative ABC transport system permease protein
MVTVAAWTSSRRLSAVGVRGAFGACLVAIVTGAAATVAVVLAARALPVDVRQVVPFAAQIIGGSMTGTTLASLRMLDDTQASWHEVEGWLAIGATPRVAVRDIGRRAAQRALVPVLDQTRNVGLVVLPGAFVGLLLAGASPLEAGRLQLLVLVGLITAQTIAVAIVTALLGGTLGLTRPGRHAEQQVAAA